ncbi:MAG: hypothetical protein Q4G70_15435, partial [Pseudomonadota bacterium]|nr:hypothetical protein [Pseudomonadota bacterium]
SRHCGEGRNPHGVRGSTPCQGDAPWIAAFAAMTRGCEGIFLMARAVVIIENINRFKSCRGLSCKPRQLFFVSMPVNARREEFWGSLFDVMFS